MVVNISGGAIPSEGKVCPYGLRYRNGMCVSAEMKPKPSDRPDKSTEPDKEDPDRPIHIPHVTVDVKLRPIFRQRNPKVRKYSKTKEGRLKSSKPYSKLKPEIQEKLVNLKPGEKFETVGRGRHEHIPSKPELETVKGMKRARTLSKGMNALAVLDVVDTLGELLENDVPLVEAIPSIPQQYVDGLIETAKDVYEAAKNQDYVGLGVIAGDVADISTPMTRFGDLVGRQLGAGNVASEAIDNIREDLDLQQYTTEDTTETFLEKMADNYQKIGTPTKLFTTLGGKMLEAISNEFENETKQEGKRHISPRAEHESKSRTYTKESWKDRPHGKR